MVECINPRNPRVRGNCLSWIFLYFFPKKNQTIPSSLFTSSFTLLFFSRYDTTVLSTFSLPFFPLFSFSRREENEKSSGREACFFCFDALPGTGIRLQFLKKTRHTVFFNLSPTSSGFSKEEWERERERERESEWEKERERVSERKRVSEWVSEWVSEKEREWVREWVSEWESSFCLSGEPLIPRFSPRPHARNYHDFRFFARPLPAPTRMIFPSRSFLPPFWTRGKKRVGEGEDPAPSLPFENTEFASLSRIILEE